jgi:periplasmic protein TonB
MNCCFSNLNWRVLGFVLLAHLLLLAGIPELQQTFKPETPETVLLASLLTLQSEPPAPVMPKPEPPKPVPPKPTPPKPPVAVQPQPEPPPVRVEPTMPPPVVQIAVARPAPVVAPTSAPAPVVPVAPLEQPKPPIQIAEAVAVQSKPTPSAASQARERDEFNAYLMDLMRHLKRHKKYPSSLKKAKVEGKVTLRFTLDAFGRVVASAVSVGSGNAELDQAAMSMLARANPLPAMPKSLQKDQQTLVIPIEYSLITDR